MSYSIVTHKNVSAPEVCYKLTSDPGKGAVVAAKWSVEQQPNNTLDCRWRVRQIEKDGTTTLNAHGLEIRGVAYENITVSEIASSGGSSKVKEQLLLVALGEPDAIRDVPDDIRDAIQAASFTTSFTTN